MRKKILLIANPAAGRGGAGKIRQAQRFLGTAGRQVELYLTSGPGDATAAAARAGSGGYDLVVAAGGDGTLNEVVAGLAPSNIPLAYLPLGTTNVFALETGIPFDIGRACAIALQGAPRPICLGRAGRSIFLNMAGVGFDARVVVGVNLGLKRLGGKFAYIWSGLVAWCGWRPEPIEIVPENGPAQRGYGAIVSNGRYYGGRFSITPGASPLADRLDVCLFKRGRRPDFLNYAWRIALGRPLEPPAVSRFTARRLTIRGNGVPVQVDGDYLGTLPMDFEAVFGEITMILPDG